MLTYLTSKEVIDHRGLRIVLVQGLPSPWGQAAKTIFEIKKLDYVAAAFVPGEGNRDLVAWGGTNSAPIVAWADEKPIDRWNDILHLAERLAPEPAMIPAKAGDRALMFGLSNEICGQLGIGWNRRLQMIAPMLEGQDPPAMASEFGAKYGYNAGDAREAGRRAAGSLGALSGQLKAQYARGVKFFVGDGLSALDIYFTSFMNLLDPLPEAQCPMPEAWRPAFKVSDPQVSAAMDPILVEHRDRIFKSYFRDPMEF